VTGGWSVVDRRAGSPDGTDTLANIERLQFTDAVIMLSFGFSAALESAFVNILRAPSTAPINAIIAADISSRLSAGTLNDASAIGALVTTAGATTSVATLAYEFFTGKIPSAGGIDYLVSPTGPNANNINGAYYQNFSLENRYINFAVNLGKLGEGNASFTTSYGGKALFDATRDAYATIFGSTPTDAKLHALLDPSFVLNGVTMTRAEYFASYGQDGASGIGTKAAMVGWLLAEAEKADVGMYARSNEAFLTDLADGAAFAVDIVAAYGKPEYVFTG
jgi:hypothetical protein